MSTKHITFYRMTTDETTITCPYAICDGSGVVEQVEEETNATFEADCPCTNDADHD